MSHLPSNTFPGRFEKKDSILNTVFYFLYLHWQIFSFSCFILNKYSNEQKRNNMQIQPQKSLAQQKNIQFGALKIATIKNSGRNTIDIYKLTEKDDDFIDFLDSTTDYNKIAPDLPEDMRARWQKIFHYCIEEIRDGFNQNFVAISNKKPCGILTGYCNETSSYLDGVCKIPSEENKNLRNAGKSLILHFLKTAQKANSKTISLDAVKDGPFDVISMYEKLNFKKVFPAEDSGKYQPMEMNKYKLKEQIKSLESKFNYKEEKSREEVNLLNLIS